MVSCCMEIALRPEYSMRSYTSNTFID